MPRYDRLAITAMDLDPAAAHRGTYSCLPFPGAWKEPLRRLAQSTTGKDKASIPIRSLNEAIAAVVADCIITMTYAGYGSEDEDWLLADHEIDTSAIYALVAAWIRSQKAAPEQIQSTLADLDPNQLAWHEIELDPESPGQRQRAMRLLPMTAAAALSAPDLSCPHGELAFRRCTTDTGAELISWPPLHVEDETPYSVKITATAQTLPGHDEALLYLEFGVRRWMPTRTYLSTSNGHNVYLEASIPYLAGLRNSPHFGRARIRRCRTKNDAGESTYRNQWDDPFAAVLREAGCLNHLPDPEQLTNNPMDYLRREQRTAALVHSNSMSTNVRVSAGLPLADREPLMEWAAHVLGPGLRPVGPLPRVTTKIYTGLGRPADHTARATTIPAAVVDVVGGRLDVELFTDTTIATAHALQALSTRLGTPLPEPGQLGEKTQLIEVGPLTLGIRRPSATIAHSLDRGAGSAQRSAAAAAGERITTITAELPRAEHPTVAVVEIGHPDSYQGAQRGNDPIFAARHGLALTGRLSQFVTPVTEAPPSSRRRDDKETSDPNRERYVSAIDEIFRHLAVRPEPLPQPRPDTIPERPAMLAVWLINTNRGRTWGVRRTVPVAVLIDPTGQHVQVHAPDVGWQPWHTGMLALAERYTTAPNQTADGITAFIRQTVDETAGAYPDTLLLTHAQNLRRSWPAISNTKITVDTLTFGHDRRPITDFPGLRHVRIRTDDEHETPECFGVADTTSGQPTGLWRYRNERLYGSTGTKPSTAASALKGVSKITSTEHRDKTTAPRPTTQVWNQQFIEIFAAGLQPGDNPDYWAAVAHELRWAAPYSKVTTVLPWPLHLAKQAEEYLLPANLPTTP